jgi:hypothetical protein
VSDRRSPIVARRSAATTRGSRTASPPLWRSSASQASGMRGRPGLSASLGASVRPRSSSAWPGKSRRRGRDRWGTGIVRPHLPAPRLPSCWTAPLQRRAPRRWPPRARPPLLERTNVGELPDRTGCFEYHQYQARSTKWVLAGPGTETCLENLPCSRVAVARAKQRRPEPALAHTGLCSHARAHSRFPIGLVGLA